MHRLTPSLTGLLLTLLLALPAIAEPLADARGAHRQADQALVAAMARQARLRAAHESLIARIRVRKGGGQAGLPGVSDGTLDALLKQSHDLAAQLEAADREIVRTRRLIGERRAALLIAIDRALVVANQQVAQRSGDARKAAFAHMQTLAAERARLQAAQRPEQRGQPGTVRLPAVADGASADELRELADEASDNAERVRGQLDALEARLSALNTRRTMLRASSAMDGDLALFGEDERNRRIARADRLEVGEPTSGNDGATRGDVQAPAAQDERGSPALGGGGEAPEAAPPDPGAPDGSPDRDGDGLANQDDFADAVDPPVGVIAPSIANGDVAAGGAVVFETALDPALLEQDVEALSPSALADQLAALKRTQAALRKAAEELAKRRAALEARASSLENE